jgi:hypothetical protein
MLVRRWIALEVTSDCRNIGDFLEAPDKMHLICLEIGSANEPINIIDIHSTSMLTLKVCSCPLYIRDTMVSAASVSRLRSFYQRDADRI